MAYTYSLGAVKPHVAAAANSIGPMFGIRTIYGWRPVDPFPDHPSGLALDFMIPNRQTGDALAAYVIANAGSLGVKYLIWYRQTWNPAKGWHPYTGSSNPHTDHVHVTFLPQGGSGGLTVTPVGLSNVALPGTEALSKLNDALKYLITPGAWKRVGVFFGGAALVIIAVVKMQGAQSAVGQVVNVAKKVAS